jgi:hypothetical protein
MCDGHYPGSFPVIVMTEVVLETLPPLLLLLWFLDGPAALLDARMLDVGCGGKYPPPSSSAKRVGVLALL